MSKVPFGAAASSATCRVIESEFDCRELELAIVPALHVSQVVVLQTTCVIWRAACDGCSGQASLRISPAGLRGTTHTVSQNLERLENKGKWRLVNRDMPTTTVEGRNPAHCGLLEGEAE